MDGTQIMLEGHADSRGSSEYNLALGTRRANSVKDYLVSLGVPTTRVTVVSKGKEAPFCVGRDRGLLAAESPGALRDHREIGSGPGLKAQGRQDRTSRPEAS